MVASGNVGVAWAMVVGAGAASSLGACVVFCVRMATPKVVAASLGFAAGVMMYVVFTEILMVECNDLFHQAGYSVDASYRLATICFFGGVLLTALLDAFVHLMMHWAAKRRRRVQGGRAGGPSCCSASGEETAHDACALPGIASPASSECGEEHPIALRRGGCVAQPVQLCASCAALDAANAKEQAASTGDSKESEMEMGSIAGGSKDAMAAAASPTRISVRRQPCCAGNPDCCGPTARCYNTGVGPAAAEIVPGTEAAEVVAVLQSDPHTQDLLRMGIVTGVAICVHNIPEGLATFVGALNDAKIPEGICVAMPIYYSTGSKWKGFLWGSLTGFAEPLGGLIGYLAVQEQDPLSFAIVFGLVSGMMVYVAIKELLPSAFRFDPKDKLTSTGILIGMAVMAISLLLFTL
ncbi:zinc transporter [Chlorella sorokiniana]|uniref:Zinc transporter n=1 Tax=Chlorella sorokiniana TaxID=3076 RepID=A0A2P6U044_CHLSO|nr:zinc transporter [Chlorella sorokiniana]|eukprot:PRW59678.1 zinc transporter [Chlorella sorokiniana]